MSGNIYELKEHGSKEHGSKKHGSKKHGSKEHGSKEHGSKDKCKPPKNKKGIKEDSPAVVDITKLDYADFISGVYKCS